MYQKRHGIIPADDGDTVTVLVDLSDIGNINRKRLQELKSIDDALSRPNLLMHNEGEILERMVEIVIFNLRRKRDRLNYPDEDLENKSFRRNIDNQNVLNGRYSERAKIMYALVEEKVKAALSRYWDRLYEPLEVTAIFPKAISSDTVLVVISRMSTSERQSEEKFRSLTSIGRIGRRGFKR